MAVTRSWEEKAHLRAPAPAPAVKPARRGELPWLLGASLMVSSGLALVYFAKTQGFQEASERLRRGELLDVNTVTARDQFLPFLQIFPTPAERELLAARTFDHIRQFGPLRNIGALARLRITQSEVEGDGRWDIVRKRMQEQLAKQSTKTGELRLALLPLGRLKPVWVVRTPQEFQKEFVRWVSIYLAAFYSVYLLWRIRRLQGDPAILPALHLLTGMGLILMISLRDPLRDTLEFTKFAWGVALGCGLLLLPLFRVFSPGRFSQWCYTPLFLSFALFVAEWRYGYGPAGNDSKVNLGSVQPVEVIKLLLVLFLAGYFAGKWEHLRDLRQKRPLPFLFRRLDIPRFGHVLPVLCAVAIALGFFFLLKDLGPALVLCFLFLAMFAVARGRSGLALLGVVLMVAGIAAGYHLGQPRTVTDRIAMWLSPWDNDVHGGNQLAHSLWALSTGGLWGSGPGWGDPEMIPAGDTDLVLPAIGEEWGFVGVLTIFVLFGLLVHRSLGIALRAPTEYAFFLALGMTSLLAFEMLLISGGVLGVIPLTGVVSPFLSSGNTAMLANFLVGALLLSVSQQSGASEINTQFQQPVRRLKALLGACALVLLATAAYYQAARDREILARDTRVFEQDGIKRAQHNPRLNSIAREIPRGSIFDRHGILLATSDWNELERHRAEYAALGVSIEQACSRFDSRHYPFGSLTAHFLGDLRTGENFHASNASLVEHDSNSKLQGYADYGELIPIVRYRHQPANPALRRLRERDRNVRTSIDIRLQMRAARILQQHLELAGKEKGAVVVMDARSGDVLAMVSQPRPVSLTARTALATPDQLLDRARYGQYPPGSTFKLVTAIAALRANSQLRNKSFLCQRLPDGRVGARIKGWNRPIHDDIGDAPHGVLQMERAIVVSCNAYFAQLGVHNVGAKALAETAKLLEIPAGELADLKPAMPFAAYGQGPVLITPFKMARVAATIAANGRMPQGRWIVDESNPRTEPPREVLKAEPAAFLAGAMRAVVTSGTARRAMQGCGVSLAGKTGTAQLDQGEPHAWFAGFAPWSGNRASRIAFAVVVEHGGYGGKAAAPIAREIMEAAQEQGLVP